MSGIKDKLRMKLPSRQEGLQVFAVVVFIVFTWMLYRFFYYVPSWLEYLSVWSVLVIAAYTFSFALVESLLCMGFLAFLSLVFPAKYFKDRFVPQGSAVALVSGVGAFLLQRKVGILSELENWQILASVLAYLFLVVLLIFVTAWLCGRFRFVSRLAHAITERMTIFVYLYAPLGLLGLVVVILRNLF